MSFGGNLRKLSLVIVKQIWTNMTQKINVKTDQKITNILTNLTLELYYIFERGWHTLQKSHNPDQKILAVLKILKYEFKVSKAGC